MTRKLTSLSGSENRCSFSLHYAFIAVWRRAAPNRASCVVTSARLNHTGYTLEEGMGDSWTIIVFAAAPKIWFLLFYCLRQLCSPPIYCPMCSDTSVCMCVLVDTFSHPSKWFLWFTGGGRIMSAHHRNTMGRCPCFYGRACLFYARHNVDKLTFVSVESIVLSD